MYACATKKGLYFLEFTDPGMLEMEFMYLHNRLNAVILPGVNPHLDQVQIETQESFQGKKRALPYLFTHQAQSSRNQFGRDYRNSPQRFR